VASLPGAAGVMMWSVDDREQLLERLSRTGHDPDEIEHVAADGRLATLAVELELGGERQHSLTYVARSARLPPRFLREVMQAAGRPNPAPRERPFTDEDIELARLIRRFLDAGLPREGLLEVSRVLSQGMSHTADAVRRLAGDALLRPGDSEYTVGLRYAQAAEELGPLVGPLLDLHFRAHLRDGIRRELVTEAEREAGRLAGTREVAVAFADLVDYTRLGEQIPAEELGSIAGRLHELSVGAVRQPARLVKTIGDAAMFVSPDTDQLLSAIVDLVREIEAEGERFPSVRVGVAHGPATTRGGDWFGAPVNVASRVTDLAKPGRILATEAVKEHAPERDWRRTRRRGLKGVDGRVRLFALEAPAGPEAETPRPSRRRGGSAISALRATFDEAADSRGSAEEHGAGDDER